MNNCINPNCANPKNQNTMLFCTSCGSELLLEGRYRATRQLGGGGFGKTYEVSDRDGTTKVLKLLNHNHPKYIELFQREARVLQKLNYPGIPKVEPDAYFTFKPKDSQEPLHCLVMEKIEGLDLEKYIKHRGTPIQQKRALQWLIELANILCEVHKQNFFHRDIKPSNIMLRANGQLVLIDFGAVREVTQTCISKQSSGQITWLVSPGYTPPEQMNGQAVRQSDFFALGRTFVYLLTGKHPGEMYDSDLDDFPWRDAAPDLSPLLADFLDLMMARVPDRRPQNIEAIQQHLIEIYRTLYPNQDWSQPKAPTMFPANQSTIPLQFSRSPTADNGEKPISFMPSQTKSGLDPGFISRCQEELAGFIGPMASILCKRTLKKHPELSAREFVEALAKKIPDREQALEFQRHLLY